MQFVSLNRHYELLPSVSSQKIGLSLVSLPDVRLSSHSGIRNSCIKLQAPSLLNIMRRLALDSNELPVIINCNIIAMIVSPRYEAFISQLYQLRQYHALSNFAFS